MGMDAAPAVVERIWARYIRFLRYCPVQAVIHSVHFGQFPGHRCTRAYLVAQAGPDTPYSCQSEGIQPQADTDSSTLAGVALTGGDTVYTAVEAGFTSRDYITMSLLLSLCYKNTFIIINCKLI